MIFFCGDGHELLASEIEGSPSGVAEYSSII
jgi:hypothetical protein